MKYTVFRAALIAILIFLVIFVSMPLKGGSSTKFFAPPALPQPIAKAPAVITAAGQSTDTYIIRDIANQLMIRSFFMPQAKDVDLRDINTIVFVVGYSSLGTKLQNISYEEEKDRLEKLLKKAEEEEIKILTVALGGEYAREDKTEELLRLVGAKTDYFIGFSESATENTMTKLAKERDVPMTLVNEVKDISSPFASAFR